MNTTSQGLKSLEQPLRNRRINGVIATSRRHTTNSEGLNSKLRSAEAADSSHAKGMSYAILPACFPVDIFKAGKRTDEILIATRKFQGEIYTVLSHGKVGVRELRVLLALISMLMEGGIALGDEDPFLDSVRIAEIRRVSATKSNYADVKQSIRLLEDTQFGFLDGDLSGPLISVDSDDELSTMTISFHSLVVGAIRSCFKLADESFTPFTVVYVDEQQQLKSGKHSEIALLMHAYFSQSVSQGKTSIPYRYTTLAKKMFEIELGDITRNHLTAIKGGLNRLSDLGWDLDYLSCSRVTISRPKRKASTA
jgi:hypothetical protein